MKMMKQIATALLVTSAYSFAGGDIAPVEEPVVEIPAVVEVEQTKFYVGLGYSCLQMGLDMADVDSRAMSSISAAAGYNINQYLAIEGRYTASMGDVTVDTRGLEVDVDTIDMSNIGVYLKPQYTMNSISLYALLGYGQFTIDDGTSISEAGVQYGIGLNAMVSDSVGVYVDFRRLYDDSAFDTIEDDVTANSYTVGVNYHF